MIGLIGKVRNSPNGRTRMDWLKRQELPLQNRMDGAPEIKTWVVNYAVSETRHVA